MTRRSASSTTPSAKHESTRQPAAFAAGAERGANSWWPACESATAAVKRIAHDTRGRKRFPSNEETPNVCGVSGWIGAAGGDTLDQFSR